MCCIGTIPSAVGKMAALEELSLYKNKLTGNFMFVFW